MWYNMLDMLINHPPARENGHFTPKYTPEQERINNLDLRLMMLANRSRLLILPICSVELTQQLHNSARNFYDTFYSISVPMTRVRHCLGAFAVDRNGLTISASNSVTRLDTTYHLALSPDGGLCASEDRPVVKLIKTDVQNVAVGEFITVAEIEAVRGTEELPRNPSLALGMLGTAQMLWEHLRTLG
jgi:hypothetical protein